MTDTTPYADSFAIYRAAGWESVLPLPVGAKFPPPNGYTGAQASIPSYADCQTWADRTPDVNLALRLPDGVIGLDVDAYAGKPGAATLDALTAECGPLPESPRSTSRDDGVSGIRLFHVPLGTRLITALPGVDLIQAHHRYVVAWPSTHPEGGTYRWLSDDDEEVDIPSLGALPELPAAWLERLTDTGRTTNLDTDVDVVVLSTLPDPDAEPCPCIVTVATDNLAQADAGKSRHDAYLAAVTAVLGQGRRGCPGAVRMVEALGRSFVYSLEEKPRPGTRADRSRDAREYLRLVDHGCRVVAAEPQQPPGCPALYVAELAARPTAASTVDFFDQTPELAYIRDIARHRLVNPWLLLGLTAAYAVAACPPRVVIPPFIGTRASLNLYVAAYGPSGAGKSSALGLALSGDVLPAGLVDSLTPSSGEGILALFVSTDSSGEQTQHREAVFATVDEVGTLGAQQARSGSTLGGVLRSAWTGSTLSQQGAEASRRRHLDAGTYRFCLAVGVQPSTASVLLNDDGAGTPQRFLWLPATDPDATVDAPAPGPNPFTGWQVWRGNLDDEVRFPPEVETLVKANHLEQVRGGRNALDGHALLARMKLAVGLALIHGMTRVDPVIWGMSGAVMAVSDQTRAQAVAAVAETRRTGHRARGVADAESQAAALEAKVERVAGVIARRVWKVGSQRRKEANRAVASPDRDVLDPALDLAVDRGWLARRDDGAYVPGERRP